MVLQAQEGLSDQEACDRWSAICAGRRRRGWTPAWRSIRRCWSASGTGCGPRTGPGGSWRTPRSWPARRGCWGPGPGVGLHADLRRGGHPGHRHPAAGRDPQAAAVLAGTALAARVREALARDDDYATPGKPPCDWDDPAAREQLVDELVRDAGAALAALEGEALERGGEGGGRAVGAGRRPGRRGGRRRDVPHRPPGRPGPGDLHRGPRRPPRPQEPQPPLRRLQGAPSVDPDSELIDEVMVTPANAPDADAVDDLVPTTPRTEDRPSLRRLGLRRATPHRLKQAGYEVIAKVPPATNRAGPFSKDDFAIDLEAGTVTCPAGVTVAIRPAGDGGGRPSFAEHCAACPLRERAPPPRRGARSASTPKRRSCSGPSRPGHPRMEDAYRQPPQVERKIAHFVRRPGAAASQHPGPPRHHRRRHPRRRCQLGPARRPRRGPRDGAWTLA